MPVLRTNFRESRPMDVAVRRWNEMGREAHRVGGQLWQEEMLPKHFQVESKILYHHQPRRQKYLAGKQRAAERGFIQAADIDNLYTGRMYHYLSSTAVVRAFPTRATINMIGPRYMTMRVFQGDRAEAAAHGMTYGKGQKFSATAGLQPDKKAEILTDTDEDVARIVQAIDHRLWEQVSEGPATPKTTNL